MVAECFVSRNKIGR